MSSQRERQLAEQIAIEAIFAQEYEELSSSGFPAFLLHLKQEAQVEPEKPITTTGNVSLTLISVAIDLEFKMTEGYPMNNVPEILVIKKKGVTNAQVSTLQELLDTRAKELLGQEMAYELINLTLEYMLDKCCKRHVSFHESMRRRQENAEAQQEEQERAQKEAELAAKEAQDAQLEKKILEELEARNQHLSKHKKSETPKKELGDPAILTMAVPTELVLDPPIQFVEPLTDIGMTLVKLNLAQIEQVAWPFGPVFKADSLSPMTISVSTSTSSQSGTLKLKGHSASNVTLAVKRIDPVIVPTQPRRLDSLVRQIEEAIEIPYNEHLIPIYGVQLVPVSDQIVGIYLVEQWTDSMPLEHLLQSVGHFSPERALVYCHQMLHALTHLHSHGVVHRAICLKTCWIGSNKSKISVSASNSQPSAYLTDPIIFRAILRANSNTDEAEILGQADWLPPEERKTTLATSTTMSKKGDIWMLGMVLMSMLGAKDIESLSQGSALHSLLSAMLAKNYNDRPMAQDLLSHRVFSEPANMLLAAMGSVSGQSSPISAQATGPPSRRKSPMPNPTPAPPSEGLLSLANFQVKDFEFETSSNQSLQDTKHRTSPSRTLSHSPPHIRSVMPQPITSSRYLSDFEQISLLGKGGFGQVFKVRNRIDGRFYAIKRILLNSQNLISNRKTLREVTTLSRLYHERVVRYYQAWIEDVIEDGQEDKPAAVSRGETTEAMSRLMSSTTSMSGDSFIVFAQDKAGGDTDHDHEVDLESSSTSSGDELKANGKPAEDWINTRISSSVPKRPAKAMMYALVDSPSMQAANFSLSKLNTTQGDDSVHATLPSTSPTSASVSAEGRPSTPVPRKQYLYIQMEYCPNQSLREYIDDCNASANGLDPEEAWRLFRQILEGLSYIHKQGMIHRDLKPGNIFIDAQGDAKIGDFGLAVTSAMAAAQKQQLQFEVDQIPLENEQVASHTAGIGTPFYVAPELLSSNSSGVTLSSKYNQRVDTYSLGIIFVELWTPFATRMERFMVLKDVRLPEIKLPKQFNKAEMEFQRLIAKSLLTHDSKARITATDLLKSDWLPARMEDETLVDAIKALSNPSTPYYTRLLQAIFVQSMDRHKDFVYDYKSGNVHDPVLFANAQRVRDTVTRIFQKHGAIEFHLPLFALKTDPRSPSLTMLDPQGQLVELPYDLTRPFARFIALHGIADVKRFAFERIFRPIQKSIGAPSTSISTDQGTMIAGQQPRQPHECDFDIVSSSPAHDTVDEAEVLRVAMEVLQACSCGSSNLVFVLNDWRLLEWFLSLACGPGQRAKIDQAMQGLAMCPSNPFDWAACRARRKQALEGILNLDHVLTTKDLQVLCGPLSSALVRLEALLPPPLITTSPPTTPAQTRAQHARIAYEHLLELGYMLTIFGVEQVMFDPMLTYQPAVYNSGLVFQILTPLKSTNKVASTGAAQSKPDILACGGRYDRLIDHYKLPSARQQHQGAVGVTFSVSKLVTGMDKRRAAEGLSERLIDLDVLVYSFGAELLLQRMSICGELWQAGMRAEFMRHDDVNQEILGQAARARGINWAVVLRSSASSTNNLIDLQLNEAAEILASTPVTIRIRNLERRTEQDVPRREDLVPMLISCMNSTVIQDDGNILSSAQQSQTNVATTIATATPVITATATPVIHICLQSAHKSRLPTMKNNLMEKAMRCLGPLLKANAAITVIIHDLPSILIHRLCDLLNQQPDNLSTMAKKFFSSDEAQEHRECLIRLRQLMNQVSLSSSTAGILFFNHRDQSVDYCHHPSAATAEE